MANRTRQETSAALRASCGCTGLVCVLVMACVLCLVPPRSGADEREDEDRGQQGKFCSATAHAVFRACGHEVQDTYWRAVASCINISDHAQRAHCFTDAKAARREGMDLCHTQRTERHAVCQALGEDRYDPAFDPALFDDRFSASHAPEPLLPAAHRQPPGIPQRHRDDHGGGPAPDEAGRRGAVYRGPGPRQG